jgi:hypothetical protein
MESIFSNNNLFEILIATNPNPFFLVRISELSKQIRKQLWDILYTAASIDIHWVNTLASKLNNIKNNKGSSFTYYSYKDYKNVHNIYDNPWFIQKADNSWILCNVLYFSNDNTIKVCNYTLVKNKYVLSGIETIQRAFIIKWDLVTTAITLKWKHMEYLYRIELAKNTYKN